MSQKTKVLIIGAGPTGLMAACQLRRQGIEPIIIDKKSGTTTESGSVLLQARSMEIYDQMGIVNEALLKGEILHNVQFHVKGKKVQEIELNKLSDGASPFPFVLVLEQSKNEELLYHYLQKIGGDVQWETEMISLLQEGHGAIVAVKKGSETWDIDAEYIIAADGEGSAVQAAMEIPSAGNKYAQFFYVADTAIESGGGKDALSLFLSGETFMALFPMQGKDRYRVMGILPSSFGSQPPASFEAMADHLQKSLNTSFPFGDTTFFSVHPLQQSYLEHFHKANVFFAGDAAHVHSPAGGQGMNTGLQDAHNLAWKLAMVLKGWAHPCLLQTYEQERLPYVKSLILSSKRMFGMLTSNNRVQRLIRLGILPRLLPMLIRFKKFRRGLFRSLAHTGNKYVNSDLTINRILQSLPVKAGERFPHLCTADGEPIFHAMKQSLFHALVFTSQKDSSLAADMRGLEASGIRGVQVHDFSNEHQLCATLGIKNDVVILVRPDHYIGLVTDEGAKVVGDYLYKLGEEKKVDGVFMTKTHP